MTVSYSINGKSIQPEELKEDYEEGLYRLRRGNQAECKQQLSGAG